LSSYNFGSIAVILARAAFWCEMQLAVSNLYLHEQQLTRRDVFVSELEISIWSTYSKIFKQFFRVIHDINQALYLIIDINYTQILLSIPIPSW